ncbi:hypothetical protein MARSALSMR5_04340 (plasmid) [Marinobacter salarius]|uniref:Uncharacterized protein n=2 Tax=Marinobacter salarius TaxID=1420917 RepID=A0A1W6KG15_9GAMM|nr:hypothetical protein MARSALSMR5_04340 [Marinobacter salarius]
MNFGVNADWKTEKSMRIALYVMAALVIGAFIKGIADMQAAVEAGMSPQSVLFGAAPMILIGLISLF